MKHGRGATGETCPSANDGFGERAWADGGVDNRIHLRQSSGEDGGAFGNSFQIVVGANADALLLGGEDNATDFHLFGKLVGPAPVDGNGATQIERDGLEFEILGIAQDEASPLESGVGQVSPKGLGVELKEPRRGDRVFMTEDEGETGEKTIGIGSDFPGGGLSGAAKAFLRSKEGVGGSEGFDRAGVGNFGKREELGWGRRGEGGGGESGGEIRGQGASELVILGGLKSIGGIQGKEEADGFGSVGGHGAEGEGEIEPRPRPRFSGKVLDRNEHRGGRHLGGRGEAGKKRARVGHEGDGGEEAEGNGRNEGEDARNKHESL